MSKIAKFESETSSEELYLFNKTLSNLAILLNLRRSSNLSMAKVKKKREKVY